MEVGGGAGCMDVRVALGLGRLPGIPDTASKQGLGASMGTLAGGWQKEGVAKVYCTRYPKEVSNPNTNQARSCLAFKFRQFRVVWP